MNVSRRHMLFATGATLAGGTVAAGVLLRKSGQPFIHTPVSQAQAAPLLGLLPLETPVVLPDAGFLDAEGRRKTLADFRGTGLVVNLWATWCAPCVAEMPALQGLAQRVAEKGVRVLPLSSDRGGAAQVEAFYRDHAITDLPVWLDPRGEAARRWGARGLPTTLVIDRTGRDRARVEGAFDWASDANVAAVLALVG